MKHLTGLITACLAAALMTVSAFSTTALPEIHSETYLVMDAASGQVLLERGAHTRMYPASITKILTCALALEHMQEVGDTLDSQHTMTYEATHTIDPGSTHIALTEEEVVTLRDLVYTTMIESANDAANGLAEYTAGSLDAFPALMNQKAQELGATDSHFVNANGLHDPDHYTSAYDMALITRWALGIEGFREAFGATEYTVPVTNKQPVERNFGTHHHMLVESQYYYEGTTGGKLGWTPEAQHTLVTLAERNGLELICVVMKSSNQYDKYEDAAALLNACFADYSACEVSSEQYVRHTIPVMEGENQTGEIVFPSQSFSFARPAAVAKVEIKGQLIAPQQIQQGESIEPTLQFTGPDGELLAEFPLEWEYHALTEPVQPVAATGDSGTAEGFSLTWWQILLLVLAAMVLLLLLIRQWNLYRRRQRRKKRAARLAARGIDVAPEFRRRHSEEERRTRQTIAFSSTSRDRDNLVPVRRYPRDRGRN